MNENEIGKLDNPIANEVTLKQGLKALFLILRGHIQKAIDLERISRVAILLIKSGTSKHNPVFQEIAKHCLMQQKPDGGWIGIEDSLWAVSLLKEFKEHSQEYSRGLDWLKKQQLGSGAWGKTSRDVGRIMVTGLLLYLLPELSNKCSLKWLENEWKNEFSLNQKLTYKGAFTLMALKSNNYELRKSNLIDNTLDWLLSQQNKDDGWGPYRGHPIGSSPFCTGVTLIGLLQYPNRIDKNAIVNGLKWIEKKQLADGLWPDHYIEEGSAWSFYALTEGYKFLRGRQ